MDARHRKDFMRRMEAIERGESDLRLPGDVDLSKMNPKAAAAYRAFYGLA